MYFRIFKSAILKSNFVTIYIDFVIIPACKYKL